MVATRTQVYLTEEQRKMVDQLASREGVTLAAIIRRALDAYLENQLPDPEPVLASTFGAAPDASVPSRDRWHRG